MPDIRRISKRHSANSVCLSENDKTRLIHYVIGYFLIQIINSALKNLFSFSSGVNSLLSLLAALLLVILFLRCARFLLFNKFGLFFFLEGSFILLYLVSSLIGHVPSDILLFEEALYTLGVCIPISIAFLLLANDPSFLIQFRKASYAIILIGSTVLITAATTGLAHGGAYNMSIAGMMLPGVLLLIVSLSKRFSFRDLLFVILGFFSIFMGASRWPLISILACVALCVVLSSKRRALVIMLLVVLLFVLSVFWNEIIACLDDVFAALGISSRNLDILIGGTFLSGTSQRTDFLFPYYIDLIVEKPILGWGLFGGWLQGGLGPHNMLLELILAFGLPAGLLLSIGAIVLPFAAFIKAKNSIYSVWLIVFFCMVFPMFFVEGNFVTNTAVFCLYLLAAVTLISTGKEKNPTCNKVDLAKENDTNADSMYQ